MLDVSQPYRIIIIRNRFRIAQRNCVIQQEHYLFCFSLFFSCCPRTTLVYFPGTILVERTQKKPIVQLLQFKYMIFNKCSSFSLADPGILPTRWRAASINTHSWGGAA